MQTDQGVKTEMIPVWCDNCEKQGEIVLGSFEESAFVICEVCGYETAEVWCPNCEMGGQYIRNVEDRPKSWSCPECKTSYKLPDTFYETPVPLRILSSLKPSAKMASKQEVSKKTALMLIIVWVIVLILLVSGIYQKLTRGGWSLETVQVIVSIFIIPFVLMFFLSIRNIRIK